MENNNPMFSSFISAVSRHNFDSQGQGQGQGQALPFQIQNNPNPSIHSISGGSPVPVDLVSQMQRDANQFVKEAEIKQTTPFFTSYIMIGVSGAVFFIICFMVMNGLKLIVNDQYEKRYGKMFGLALLLTCILMGLQFMYKRVNY